MFKRKVKIRKLEGSIGLGFDLARNYLRNYKWWECEIHATLGNKYITIYLNDRGLPVV